MDLCSTAFASPYPQTPTPGGSTVANQRNRPPLTSLKPLGYNLKPLIKKPHPLTQVSMIDSLSTIINDNNSLNQKQNHHHNINLNQNSNQLDQSLEDDLLAFELDHKSTHPSEHESYTGSQLNQSNQTTTNDDQGDQESDFEHDSDSFRIGLSSLSPPGIARSAPPNHQLSTVSVDPEDDDPHYLTGQDFSRDLSALSLSPIRRHSVSIPQRPNTLDLDQDLTIDHSQISPVSGFQGLARQLKHDFEQFIPSPDRSKKNKTNKRPIRGGTLKGGLPINDGSRAKRVFGSEIEQGLKKHPRFHQLHPVGLTSTPPAKQQTSHLTQTTQNQQTVPNPSNNRPINQIHKPTIRIVEATSHAANDTTRFDTSLPHGARKIVGNSVRVPDVTGLTDALRSPEVAAAFKLGNSSTGFRPSTDNAQPDPTLSEALSLLRRRLTSLETENLACQTRIRDLQLQLNHSNQPSAPKGTEGLPTNQQPDHSVVKRSSQSAIERTVQKLKVHTRRLNDSIEAHATALDELNAFKTRNKNVRQELRGVKSEVRQWSDEVEDMKDSLEGLTTEVREIRTMIEKLMKTTSQVVPENSAQAYAPSQPITSRQAPTISKINDFKAPLSKSQQEIKRNSRNPVPHPPNQSQKTRNFESQPPAQSHQTRNDIEDWRSQTSTVPNSGRSFIGPDEIQRLKKEVAQEQAMKSSNKPPLKTQSNPTSQNPSISVPQPPVVSNQPIASSSRTAPIRITSAPNIKFTGSSAPAKATDELLRGEAIINSLPKGKHDDTSCSQCRLRRQKAGANTLSSRASSAPIMNLPTTLKKMVKDDAEDEDCNVAPQIVLVKLLKDLEEDFEAHRKIFIELSETYRKMNPASTQTTKRKALAQHLRESVDTLEKKAGHIKDLYNLLHVKDVGLKPGL